MIHSGSHSYKKHSLTIVKIGNSNRLTSNENYYLNSKNRKTKHVTTGQEMNISPVSSENKITKKEINYKYGLNCFLRTISHMKNISDINQRLYVITIKMKNIDEFISKPHHITEEIYKSINRAFPETKDVKTHNKNGLFIDFDIEGSRYSKSDLISSSENPHFHGLISISENIYKKYNIEEIKNKIILSINNQNKYINFINDTYIKEFNENKSVINYICYSSKFSQSYADQCLDFNTKCYPYDIQLTNNNEKTKNIKLRLAKGKALIILKNKNEIFKESYYRTFINYHNSIEKIQLFPENDNFEKNLNNYIDTIFS